ncbi:MAG: hypothetical protein ACTHLE_13910 [Agriterribacter sp.]
MQFNTRIFKGILLTFTVSLISSGVLIAQLPASQLVLPSTDFVIRFSWQGDSASSTYEAHAAMLFPVRVKECSRTFHMQFDLGSPYSLLYKNKLEAIQRKYPAAIPSKSVNEKLENFLLTVDGTPILAKEMMVKQFDSTAIDWEDSNGIEIIGTIGADLIDGRVAMIDYPNCRFSVLQSIPGKLMQRLSVTDFIYANRSVLLPAKIKGRETMLYFDTGSSMFELLTDKATCSELALSRTPVARFSVKSWDKTLTANMFAANESIELANTIIPLRSCTYMEGVSNAQVEYMSKMGIGGMVGNKLFLNYILVLDTQRKKFGLTVEAK